MRKVEQASRIARTEAEQRGVASDLSPPIEEIIMRNGEAGKMPASSVIGRNLVEDNTLATNRSQIASGSDLVVRDEGGSSNQLQAEKEMGKIGGEGGSQADLYGITIINMKYAGQTYKLSGNLALKYPDGVNFTNEGFPDFSPYSKKIVKIEGLQGDTYYDFIKANKAAGDESTPKGYTWHHLEDGTTMMLVPSDLHATVRHTGGASLIRRGIRP